MHADTAVDLESFARLVVPILQSAACSSASTPTRPSAAASGCRCPAGRCCRAILVLSPFPVLSQVTMPRRSRSDARHLPLRRRAVTLGVLNDVLDLQLAHRSVRKFAARRRSPTRSCTAMVAAAQSAPTSSNLQPWSVVAVRDPERKARLADARRRTSGSSSRGARCSWSGSPTWAGPTGWPPAPGRGRRPPRNTSRPRSSASSTPRSPRRTPSWPPSRSASAPCSSARSATIPSEVAAELGLPPHAVADVRAGRRHPRPDRAGRGQAATAAGRGAAPRDGTTPPAPTRTSRPTTSGLAAYNERFGLPAGGWSGRVLERLAGPESMAGRHRLREVLEGLGLPSR